MWDLKQNRAQLNSYKQILEDWLPGARGWRKQEEAGKAHKLSFALQTRSEDLMYNTVTVTSNTVLSNRNFLRVKQVFSPGKKNKLKM